MRSLNVVVGLTLETATVLPDVALFLVEQFVDEPIESDQVLLEPLQLELERSLGRFGPKSLPPVLVPVGERLHIGLFGGGKTSMENRRVRTQALLLAEDALDFSVEARHRLPAPTGTRRHSKCALLIR